MGMVRRALLQGMAICALGFGASAADQIVTATGDNGGANQLRAKLAALQSTGGGTLTFNLGTATIVLAQGALPAITTTCTIDGGGNVTIDGAGASAILSISSGGSLTVQDITLTNGFNASAGGGAIVNSGTLAIDQCTLSNNRTAAAFSGGAIWSSGPLTITDSELSGNQAGNGGALYATSTAAIVDITGCDFHDNATLNTTNGWGGAILDGDGSPVTITSSNLATNSARFGGAIYVGLGAALSVSEGTITGNDAVGGGGGVFMGTDSAGSFHNTELSTNSVTGNIGALPGTGGGAISSAGTLSVTETTLSGNTAGAYNGGAILVAGVLLTTESSVFNGNSASNGGGIQVSDQSSISVTNCTISGNAATVGLGGGINNSVSAGSMSISGSTLSGNSASSSGGGIANGNSLGLTNCTISGNTAAVNGGGLFLLANSGLPSANLMNVTVAENDAAAAGGIYHPGTSLSGDITLQNTLLAQNSGGNLVRANTTGGTIKSNGSNLSDDDSGNALLTAAGDKSGTSFDAKLGPLADNGGETQTHLLGIGSDAIDAGNPAGAPTVDQRGVPRPQGPAFDIGAVEGTGAILSRFANISTRLDVETGDNVLIGGFIVSGTQPKKVLVRAIGPSLTSFGVVGPLADPVLELHDANTLLETNDNWVDSPNKQAIIDTMIAPTNDAESAIIRTLPANGAAYTAIVRGVNNSTGIALVEVYDLDDTVDSRQANISTRGLVQTNDKVMIGGFIITGGAKTVLLRALGPSLPLSGILADPMLELHNENGDVTINDNWRDTQETDITATGLAPSNDSESAILQTLPEGPYTAIVSGVGQTSGVALFEAYDLD